MNQMRVKYQSIKSIKLFVKQAGSNYPGKMPYHKLKARSKTIGVLSELRINSKVHKTMNYLRGYLHYKSNRIKIPKFTMIHLYMM